jgi:hypothetical protein
MYLLCAVVLPCNIDRQGLHCNMTRSGSVNVGTVRGRPHVGLAKINSHKTSVSNSHAVMEMAVYL